MQAPVIKCTTTDTCHTTHASCNARRLRLAISLRVAAATGCAPIAVRPQSTASASRRQKARRRAAGARACACMHTARVCSSRRERRKCAPFTRRSAPQCARRSSYPPRFRVPAAARRGTQCAQSAATPKRSRRPVRLASALRRVGGAGLGVWLRCAPLLRVARRTIACCERLGCRRTSESASSVMRCVNTPIIVCTLMSSPY
jgi:hypothetical protein